MTVPAAPSAVILKFRDPELPVEGIERLRARRAYRAGCKAIAAATIAQAFNAAIKLPGVGGLGLDEAAPIFVAAMRRELRKSGALL